MDFFGIGLPELLVILVIALVVMGPERMMTAARDVGRMIARFRNEVNAVNIQRILETEAEPKPAPPPPPPPVQTLPAPEAKNTAPEGASEAKREPPAGPVTWSPASGEGATASGGPDQAVPPREAPPSARGEEPRP